MDIVTGSAVYSRAGRDKGDLFIVISCENGYVYMADGDKRKLHNPKKKKIKHLNRTNFVAEDLANAIKAGAIEDYMIRKTLAELKPI